MGIKNLTKFIKKYAPSAITPVTLSFYKGKTIGLDISGLIYQMSYNKETKGQGQHIRTLFELIIACRQNHVRLIVVFDGKPVSEKKRTLDTRKETKINQLEKIVALTYGSDVTFQTIDMSEESCVLQSPVNIELVKTHARQAISENGKLSVEEKEQLKSLVKNYIHIDNSIFDELLELFNICGITYFRARHEADHLLARLCADHVIDGVFSEDTDMLPHGCPYLIRGINSAEFRRNGNLTEYSLATLLSEIGFTHERFVDFCILSECDYTTKIHGMGHITAYQYLQTMTLDELLKNIQGHKKFTVDKAFNHIEARRCFQYASLEDTIKLDYGWKTINIPELQTYLQSKTNYTTVTLSKKLDILRNEKPVITVSLNC